MNVYVFCSCLVCLEKFVVFILYILLCSVMNPCVLFVYFKSRVLLVPFERVAKPGCK